MENRLGALVFAGDKATRYVFHFTDTLIFLLPCVSYAFHSVFPT